MAVSVLTEKQEAFAVTYVQTANAAEAYRAAYDVAPNARDSWIYVEAAQLLDHPKIAPRIAELQSKARARSEYTIFSALDELEAARSLAMEEAQPSAAVSAVNGKIKLFGLEKARRLEVTGKDGGAIETKDTSMTEVARRLAFLLASAVEDGDNG